MKKMILVTTIMIISLLSACTPQATISDDIDCTIYPNHVDCIEDEVPDESDSSFLEIYYINDFHGALLPDDDQLGISYIGNLIKTKKALNPENTLFLAGGDILQGSALSNYYDGLSTINTLNEIGLDAFTIGNHEFDWGLDTILAYKDGDDQNGEAAFPFLGANIFYKGTTDIPTNLEPYTIIEKGDIKVGIIGTIGESLESSIATSRVADYEFAPAVDIISSYASYLRTTENVDVVISMAHETGNINQALTALEGDERIDVILNGHSHQSYVNFFGGVPQVQSGSNGENVGYIKINFDDRQSITTYEADNLVTFEEPLLAEKDDAVEALLQTYLLETDDLFNDPIIPIGEDYSESELSKWIAGLMAKASNSDIAFHNNGGTRTNIQENDVFTLSLLYQIWPFDNVVKTVELPGFIINTLISSSGLACNTANNVAAEDLGCRGLTFDNDTLYLVATNDYVFDKPSNPFIGGTNPTNTGIVLRDLAQSELELQSELYEAFYINNDLLTNPLITSRLFKELKTRY
jgi:2',3'-cyclic-nucleotide 2'-phosphodiesterase (5'-nucleotidase family)